MAAVPYSYAIYEGLSQATRLAVPFPYISRDNIHVLHTPPGGTEAEIPQQDFSWLTDREIQLATPVDGMVRVERRTYEDRQLVQWQDGSYIIAADLNLSDKQWLYVLQEHHDFMLDRRGGQMLGPLLLWRDPQLPMEAVNLQYLQDRYLPLAGGTMTGPLNVLPPVGDDNPVTKSYVLGLIGGPQGLLSTFRNPLRLFVSQAPNASDTNNGTSLAEPLQSFDEAIRRAKPGTVITVEPGTYEIANLPFRVPRDVTIRGDSLRNVVLKPAAGSETKGFFKVDSGFYCWGLTFAGHQAVEEDPATGRPAEQAWVVRFDDEADNRALGAEGLGAYIFKSPYVQNCTSYTAEDDDGTAGSVSRGSTGGGILIDGDDCASNSPIKSMVVDSYTQVNLGGPGCLVVNDGYAQLVSFFGTFCEYHVKAAAGGQVNLSGGSTSDFGEYALVADGYSPRPIYTGQARQEAYGARILDFKAAMDTATNAFTKTNHGLAQDDQVRVSGAGLPPELRPGIVYFAQVADANTFRLATTKSGTVLDLSGPNAPEIEFTRQGAAQIDVIGLSRFAVHYGRRAAAAAVPTAGQLFFPRLTFPRQPTDFAYTRESDRVFTYTAQAAPNGPDHEYAGGGSAFISGTTYGIKKCAYNKDTGKVRVTVDADLPADPTGTARMEALQFICQQSAYVVQGSTPIDGAGNPVAENSPSKAGYRVQFYSDANGGLIYPVEAGQVLDFRLRSQITAPNHTFEYVGSGMNYNALPFAGGRPNPGNHVLELNNGRVFFSGTDELGNFYVGRQFNVDGTTGTVTITTDEFNLSGLNFIGPFSRNGGISTVGVQLREVSDNENMLNSLGVPGADTVPTQRAVKQQLDIRAFFVDNKPPLDPRLGTIWVDTRGFVTPYVWTGSRWSTFSEVDTTAPLSGKSVARFTIFATAGAPVTFTARPTGAAAGQSQILWGDGTATDNAITGTHTYAETGSYTIDLVLKPETAVFDGNGWPTISGALVGKIGPFSTNLALKSYPAGNLYPDLEAIDLRNVSPAAGASVASLFEFRPLLKPAAVLGLDWAKITNVNRLIAGRTDITTLPWKTFPEVTSADEIAMGSGLAEVEAVSFPKLTSAVRAFKQTKLSIIDNLVIGGAVTCESMFEGAQIDVLGFIDLTNATNLKTAFGAATIANWTATIKTSPALLNMERTFRSARVINEFRAPMLSDVTAVTNCAFTFNGARIPCIYGLKFRSTTNCYYMFGGEGEPSGYTSSIKEIWDCELKLQGTDNLCSANGGEQHNSVRFHNLTKFGIKYLQGSGPTRFFGSLYNGGWPPSSLLTEILTTAFSSLTSFEGNGRDGQLGIIGPYYGAKLSQPLIDGLLTELDKVVTANPTIPDARLRLDGGTNAAPSAAVKSGALARLTTAGWVITTNP